MPYLMIPAAIATLAGTGLSIAGQEESKSAMNDAAQAELTRQQGYGKKGQGVFQESLAKSTPGAARQQMQQGQQQALNEYAKVQDVPSSVMPSGSADPTADKVVQARTGMSNQASAGMQGYNAFDVAQLIKDLQARTQLGQIGSFAGASEGVLPLEMQQASQKGSTLSGVGGILNSLGGLGMMGAGVSQPSGGGMGGFTTPGGGPAWSGYVNQGGMFYDPLLGQFTQRY